MSLSHSNLVALESFTKGGFYSSVFFHLCCHAQVSLTHCSDLIFILLI